MTASDPAGPFGRPRDPGFVVQDFRPLADSVEWELGQGFYAARGSGAFTRGDAVPFLVHNDGNHSRAAAELVFESLAAEAAAGPLPGEVFVLEMGIGIGLFARFFLDAFLERCDAAGVDYYDRLVYVATDYSEKMLTDAARNGVFARHPGRYLLRRADAARPAGLLADPRLRAAGPAPFRAVFLNYVLDCLPPAVLRRSAGGLSLLHVRTCLARGLDPADCAGLSPAEAARLAASPDPADRLVLADLFPLFVSHYEFRPVDPAAVPYADLAVAHLDATGGDTVLHNAGAVGALDALRGLVSPGGFVLVSDYGYPGESGEGDFEHQRYADSTAVGLNFGLLKRFALGHGTWLDSGTADEGQQACLVAADPLDRVCAAFRRLFGKEHRAWVDEPARRAAEHVRAGRFRAAVPAFAEAVARQPYNWLLMKEMSATHTHPLRDPLAGLDAARAALACAPNGSADVWNAAGESLLVLGRWDDAGAAFARAARLDPSGARAWYNLCCWHQAGRRPGLALECVARGLAVDRQGAFRDALLQKQGEVLAASSEQARWRSLMSTNRVDAPGRGDPALAPPRAGERSGSDG